MPLGERVLPVASFLVASLVLALAAPAPAAAAPAIEAVTDHVDLGDVREGTIAEGAFTLRNTGDEPLIIERVITSCKCAAVKELSNDERTIAPGGTLELPFAYDAADLIGPQKAQVIVSSNDPDNPALVLQLELDVKVLVLVRPPTVRWGRAIRGTPLQSDLRLSAGEADQGIELIDLRVKDPNVTATVDKVTEDGQEKLLINFALAPEAPLGTIETQLDATVRIAGKEYGVMVPVGGLVLGDVISTPPLVAALRVPVYPGARISEFTIRPSTPDGAIDVVDTVVFGPIRTEVVRKDPATLVQVFAAKDAPAGPQACLIEIYTTSLDQPVIKAPVYVLMAGPVAVTPDHVTLQPAASEPSQAQQVTLRAVGSLQMRVLSAESRSDRLSVDIVTPEQSDPEHPAVLRIGLVPGTSVAEPEATEVVVETDQPGAEAVRIPVLIRPSAGT